MRGKTQNSNLKSQKLIKITSVLREFSNHPLVYLLLTIILITAFFVRIYRTGDLMGFYYDQGRDALTIWRFWHEGDIFLVGPTTGIAGILRGPFYYYLIAPFYLIGGGNPVWPAVFLAATSVLAIIILFFLAFNIQDRITGIFAVLLASFSYNIILASRWLSNPTPMLLLSVVLIWLMIKVSEGKKWAWIVIAFVAGSSLFHFGSAGEVFYFPSLIVFALWQKKNLPDRRTFILSLSAFLLTLLPLVIFDFLHQGILSSNIKKFLFEEQSFKVSFWEVFRFRFEYYYEVFTNKIFLYRGQREIILLSIVSASFVAIFPKLIKNNRIKIILLTLIAPIIGLLFFQGNYGNIYDYYLTGYYLIFILLFAIVLGYLWRYKLGKVFVIFFFYVFLSSNFIVTKNKLIAGVDGPTHITLGNELQAVEWVFEDAKYNNEFNVDVYVPPVIPYSYDYLFLWRGTKRCVKDLCGLKYEPQLPIVYVLYEVDPPHPERLNNWMSKYKGTTIIEKEVSFGGVTVSRRKRI